MKGPRFLSKWRERRRRLPRGRYRRLGLSGYWKRPTCRDEFSGGDRAYLKHEYGNFAFGFPHPAHWTEQRHSHRIGPDGPRSIRAAFLGYSLVGSRRHPPINARPGVIARTLRTARSDVGPHPAHRRQSGRGAETDGAGESGARGCVKKGNRNGTCQSRPNAAAVGTDGTLPVALCRELDGQSLQGRGGRRNPFRSGAPRSCVGTARLHRLCVTEKDHGARADVPVAIRARFRTTAACGLKSCGAHLTVG